MTTDAIGGVWTYSLELARSLACHRIQVLLATMGQPLSPEQQGEAAAIPHLRVFESDYKLEWMNEPWADVRHAGEWLLGIESEFQPDIVHLNGYCHGALPWKSPVLIVAHSCVLSWWKAVKQEDAPREWTTYARNVRHGLKGAQLVIAPTQAMLSSLERNYGYLDSTRVIPNGRTTGLFTSGKKQPIVFAAGRLGDEAKNIQTLGAAADGLSWPVFVAGAEQDPSGKKVLPKNVQHCGKLPPEKLAEWMSTASIYCLPARYEPFGLSVLEAALSGCALVLGDIPSLRELWGGVALFVSPNNVEGLRRALRLLIEDPELRIAYGRSAQARARQFSMERTVEGYLRAYRELLAHAPAAAA